MEVVGGGGGGRWRCVVEVVGGGGRGGGRRRRRRRRSSKQVKLRSTLTPKTWQLEVVGGGGKDMIMSIVSNTQSTSGNTHIILKPMAYQ